MKHLIFLMLLAPILLFSQNNADEYFNKAEIFYNDGNFSEAFKFYTKSAELGDIESKANLSFMYGLGIGVQKDEEKANELFQESYEDGFNDVLDYQCDEFLHGAIPDFKIDKYYYKKKQLYKTNETEALLSLGSLYMFGTIKQQDELDYLHSILLEHSSSDCNAQAFLGFMYKIGDYLTQDDELAKKWFEKAIDNGCDYLKNLKL